MNSWKSYVYSLNGIDCQWVIFVDGWITIVTVGDKFDYSDLTPCVRTVPAHFITWYFVNYGNKISHQDDFHFN